MSNKSWISVMFVMVLILFHAIVMTSFAGITGKIAGKVTDSETNEPITGANVVIEGEAMGAATDDQGDYFILNVGPGTYTVQAVMIGYTTSTITEVQVSAERTIEINFSLNPTTIMGEEIVVVADRDIIRKDVSGSLISEDQEQVFQVPLVTDIQEFLNLQAGIEGNLIRGGSPDQTGTMVDGLQVSNNRTNEPLIMTNLSAMQELNVTKGGFNAEYGNIRSGLINIITKEGSPRVYHGLIDARYSPAKLKHSGASVYSIENYNLRPYLDPQVAFVGTANGWDEEIQKNYPFFQGWNAISEELLADGDPTNDRTSQECYDLFM